MIFDRLAISFSPYQLFMFCLENDAESLASGNRLGQGREGFFRRLFE